MEYIYITENNLESRQYYNYSKYGALDFVKAYTDSRLMYKNITQATSKEISFFCNEILQNYYSAHQDNGFVVLKYCLCNIILKYDNLMSESFNTEMLDKILKTFEVRKRLYHCYNTRFRPLDEADYYDLSLYVLFAISMVKAYETSRNLKYLNALMKVCDILISLKDKQELNDELNIYFSYCVNYEQKFFYDLKSDLLEG